MLNVPIYSGWQVYKLLDAVGIVCIKFDDFHPDTPIMIYSRVLLVDYSDYV